MFLDFKKAFNTVDHDILTTKLIGIGLDTSALERVKNYLSEHSQKVTTDGSVSSCVPIKTGVPQDSMLGPIMFLLYINDLPVHLCALDINYVRRLSINDGSLFGP